MNWMWVLAQKAKMTGSHASSRYLPVLRACSRMSTSRTKKRMVNSQGRGVKRCPRAKVASHVSRMARVKVALAAADEVVQSRGDRHDHGGGEGDDSRQAKGCVQLEDDQLKEPAVGLPRLSGDGAGIGVDAGDGVVLHDPLTRAEMPPDVGVVDAGDVNAEERGGGVKGDEDEKLRPAVGGFVEGRVDVRIHTPTLLVLRRRLNSTKVCPKDVGAAIAASGAS